DPEASATEPHQKNLGCGLPTVAIELITQDSKRRVATTQERREKKVQQISGIYVVADQTKRLTPDNMGYYEAAGPSQMDLFPSLRHLGHLNAIIHIRIES